MDLTQPQYVRHIALDMVLRYQGKGKTVDQALEEARKIADYINGRGDQAKAEATQPGTLTNRDGVAVDTSLHGEPSQIAAPVAPTTPAELEAASEGATISKREPFPEGSPQDLEPPF